ncbi:MAG TPA: molybdate ABC transporter substrate-binding protein [Gallionellaceae bacterium]
MKLLRVLLLSALLAAHSLSFAAAPLNVAVAANVKFAFDELQAEFTRASGIAVSSVVASSGKIAAQVKSGAPFDVFLSADMEFPEALYKDGLASAAPKVYARGLLVLWTTGAVDLKQGVKVLSDPAVRKVAIANPKLAPYGAEAMRVLDHYGLRAAVEPKLIYGESIAQVNQYIDTGSASIGFTAKSVVLAPQLQGRGRWVELPRESYQPIAQGVVILKHGADSNAAAAQRFIEFLASPGARAIFEKYGYLLP